jgi:hypothetical protein
MFNHTQLAFILSIMTVGLLSFPALANSTCNELFKLKHASNIFDVANEEKTFLNRQIVDLKFRSLQLKNPFGRLRIRDYLSFLSQRLDKVEISQITLADYRSRLLNMKNWLERIAGKTVGQPQNDSAREFILGTFKRINDAYQRKDTPNYTDIITLSKDFVVAVSLANNWIGLEYRLPSKLEERRSLLSIKEDQLAEFQTEHSFVLLSPEVNTLSVYDLISIAPIPAAVLGVRDNLSWTDGVADTEPFSFYEHDLTNHALPVARRFSPISAQALINQIAEGIQFLIEIQNFTSALNSYDSEAVYAILFWVYHEDTTPPKFEKQKLVEYLRTEGRNRIIEFTASRFKPHDIGDEFERLSRLSRASLKMALDRAYSLLTGPSI